MKVIYELDIDDIRMLLSDKYKVEPIKVKIDTKDRFATFRIDMSVSEEPGEEIPVPDPEQVSLEENIFEGPRKFAYDDLTDEQLKKWRDQGKSIPGIVKEQGWDSKVVYKLYKRAQRLRTESASS